MAVSYDKLWKKLIDKKMTKNALRVQAEMSSSTMAKMSKNETVSMDVMLRICKVLQCNIGDIMASEVTVNSRNNIARLCHQIS